MNAYCPNCKTVLEIVATPGDSTICGLCAVEFIPNYKPPPRTACPRCDVIHDVENFDGSQIKCLHCGLRFTPKPSKPGQKRPGWLRRLFTEAPPIIPPATHICVTCHSVCIPSSGQVNQNRGSGCGLFLLGLVVLLVGGVLSFALGPLAFIGGIIVLVGGTLIVCAVVSFVFQGNKQPKLTCPGCQSAEVIPLGTPRANALVR